MYISEDMFAIPPKTLEQLNDISRAFKENGIEPVTDSPVPDIVDCYEGCSNWLPT